jgi:SH3 domain-containing protein
LNNKNRKGRLNVKWLVFVVVLMLLIYGLSWLAFGFWLKNRNEESDSLPSVEYIQEQKPIPDVTSLSRAPISTPVLPVETIDPVEILEWENVWDASVDSQQPVLPPAGETPTGLSLIGEIRYLKCYDSTGLQKNADNCKKWQDFEVTFKDRFYLVDKCRTTISGDRAYGRLIFQMEVDREEKTIGLWADNLSNLRNSKKIVNCLEEELKGLASVNDDSDSVRYQFEIGFSFNRRSSDNPIHTPAIADEINASTLPQGQSETTESETTRLVDVVKDHVRVRKGPVDGEIVGKIRKGNRVVLIEEREGWCKVRTPRNNTGWMICWALKL